MQKHTIGLIIRDRQVYTVDVERRKRLHKIGSADAILAEADGTVIAIVHPNKRTHCYDARRGSFIGRVGKIDVESISAVDGYLFIGYHDKSFEVISLRARYPSAYQSVAERLAALKLSALRYGK